MTCRCESTEFPASNGGISAAQKSVEARHGNQRGAETALLPVFLEALARRLADRVGAGRVPAGGVVIGFLERWSVSEMIYFTFVTALTIGYGDLAPKHTLPLG